MTIFTLVCILLIMGIGSAENEELNISEESFEKNMSVKAGDITIQDMMMMATGPVLTTEANGELEGNWLFFCDESGYDDYGGYDPYGDYDPYGFGSDPFDGYDPFDSGYGSFDPYNVGIYTGSPSSIGSSGGSVPVGVGSSTGSYGGSAGSYTDVIDALEQLINQYGTKVKTPPGATHTSPTSQTSQPSPELCDCSGWGAEKCGGYVCYHPTRGCITYGKTVGTCFAQCCGSFSWNPVYIEAQADYGGGCCPGFDC